MTKPDLQQLAERTGISLEFWDWKGNHTLISDDTVIAVLGAMGLDATTPEASAASLTKLIDAEWRRVLRPCTVVEEGQEVRIDVHLPAGHEARAQVVLENGQAMPAHQVENWEPDREVDGVLRGEATFAFPSDLPLGYHTIEVATPEGEFSATLIVTPTFVGFPQRMNGKRNWGYACQLYSVSSRDSWGMGDFVDLADLSTWAGGEQGAGFVLVNPLHAPQATPPIEPSPYLPASRRFLNPLYIRPQEIPEVATMTAQEREVLQTCQEATQGDGIRVDRDRIWVNKREALWVIFQQPRRAARQIAFDTFRRCAGLPLREFATWSALSEDYGCDWRLWPEDLQDPRSERTREFAETYGHRVEFFEWLQWIAQQQLSAAQTAAEEAGMAVGVLSDLAVGIDPAGAETWMMRDVYAAGVTVGAPPDQYNQAGQDWGQPPWIPSRLAELSYGPFRDMVRAALHRVGGLRIDHIIGLFRLWWVPQGLEPAAGTYVRYDHEAMVGILALEAHRAQALIIGEDLGTVEPWVREYLSRRGLLGTGVLWWEYDPSTGQLSEPERWREYCMASVTTHDLPPTQGYLEGGHVLLRHELGILTEPLEDEIAWARDEVDNWKGRLIHHGVLEADRANDPEELMLALHRYLKLTPSKILVASLADAVGERRTQNQPGTLDEYPNWRVPLGDRDGNPITLEEIFEADLPRRLAAAISD